MPFSRRSSFVSLALISTISTSPLACGGSSGGQGGAPPMTPLVEAVEARFGALPVEVKTPGVARARNQVTIRPEITGRIVEVAARIGDAVERGQALIRLDETEARERLRQAEADVRLAEATAAAARARTAEVEARAGRTRALAGQQLVSAQELESLEAELDAVRASAEEAAARVEQRRAAVEERRSALAKTVVRAPVAGTLGDRRAEVGMLVDPSTVLFVLGDLDRLIVEVNLTESMLDRVRADLPVILETGPPAPGALEARLSRISPFLAEESFTTRGEIDVDNRDRRLRPGMFVTVRILVGQSRQATLVPVSALWESPDTGERGVFAVEETAGLEAAAGVSTASPEQARRVAFRPVEVLAEGRGAAGVAGIDEGTWVVTVGQHLLGAELQPAAAPGEAPTTTARVRPISWERILELETLQDEDLLEGFLAKQRTVAAALGAEIPASEEVVERVLAEAAAGANRPRGP